MSEFHQLMTAQSADLASGHARDPMAVGALRHLNSSALVTPNQDGVIVRFDSHPLIKAFCYDRLKTGDRRRLHRQLLALAQAQHMPADPVAIDEIRPLLDVFWHALAVDDVETAFSAWHDERVYRRLLWWGSYQSALDLVDRLISSPALRAQPAQPTKGRLLGEAGILLVKLGQSEQALDAYEEGVGCLGTDPERSLKLLLDLSEAQMEIGIFHQPAATLQRAERLFGDVPGCARPGLTLRSSRSTVRAVSAADRPSARWACIRRTRISSASEYSRKPPAERTGCSRP